MGAVRNLIVKLSADVAELQKGLDKGAAQTKKFRREVEGNFSAVRKSFDGISRGVRIATAAFAAFGVTRLVRDQIAFVDQLVETADALDVNVESYSVLVGAAKRANVEQAQLGVIMRRVADAAGSGSKAFERLGIDARTFSQLPIDQQLRKVVTSLVAIGNQSKKIAAATDLVGSRSAGQLIQFANNFEQAEGAARKFGDAVTEEEARVAKRADEILDNLGSALAKFGRQAIVFLAGQGSGEPKFTRDIEGLARQITILTKSLPTLSGPGLRIATERIAQYEAELRALSAASLAAAASQRALANPLEEIRIRAEKIVEPLRGIEGEARKLTESVRTAADALRAEIEQAQAFFEAGLINQETLTRLVSKATEEFAGAHPEVKAFNDRLQEAEETARAARTPLQEFKDEIERIKKLAAEFPQILSPEVASEAAREAAEKFRDATTQAKDNLDEMSEFAKQAARNMQDAFADFLFDPFEGGIKGMLKSFVDILRRMAAEAAAAKIFDALGLGGGGAGGGLAEGGSFLGKFAKLFGFNIPGLASGGPVSAGRPYLVGERGPEFFVPGAAGAIQPSGAGGVNFSPVYNIDARGATTDLVAALPRILRQNTEQTKAEIFDMIRRRVAPL